MKYALLSLPRSRSTCLFNELAPKAEAAGMDVYYANQGKYYYLDHKEVDPNIFCKIDPRTDLSLFEEIIHKSKDHTWYVSTRDFEDFCLSFSYALNRGKFQDFGPYVYEPFEVSYENYVYSRETYQKFIKMVDTIPEKVIINYHQINSSGSTIHIEKDYKSLCINYDQLRDWQRIDWINSQKWTRKWNCWSSYDDIDLYSNPLFSDIATGRVRMWYNVYTKGDSQDWHTHGNVKSCGTRFLKVPKNGGNIEFKNFQVDNKEHTQIVFGPEDEHRVTTNLSEEPRITVSWNVL